MDSKESLNTNALRALRSGDGELSHLFERIRWEMIKSAKISGEPLPIPQEVKLEDLAYIIDSFWEYHNKIHESRLGLLDGIKYDVNPRNQTLEKFRSDRIGDEAQFELLSLALHFPGLQEKDRSLFEKALCSIENRMKVYSANTIGFVSLAKLVLSKIVDPKNIEAEAIQRAIVLEAALSQGINESEAEEKVTARWKD